MSGKCWEAYDAYLFDIDGTLLRCTDAVHYFAFLEALALLAERPVSMEGVGVHGNTDVGILRDALQMAGVSEANWRPRLAEAKEGMCRFVEARVEELCTSVLPGVRQLLTHLHDSGRPLGVATGNLQRIGRAKLQRAELHDFFSFAGYSDPYEYRRDVFRGAVEQARKLAGTAARLCVVGDTPEDVRAAQSNGLAVVAVATGTFSLEQLQAERPDLCVPSLEELLPAANLL